VAARSTMPSAMLFAQPRLNGPAHPSAGFSLCSGASQEGSKTSAAPERGREVSDANFYFAWFWLF
jgi:hypothetical protein